MSYKHLSQTERYQMYALMKAGQNIKTIIKIQGRYQSTISRKILLRFRSYRPRQADIICQQRDQASRNSIQINLRTRALLAERLNLQWSPYQIAASLPVSHETIYQNLYADKVEGGVLWKHLRCPRERRKRYASGKSRRGEINGKGPLPNVLLVLRHASGWPLGRRHRD